MKDNETVKIQTSNSETEEQEIDLIELAQKICKEWRLILKFCGIAVFIGLIVAFSLPKEYTTMVQLAPESTDGAAKGNLSGLAAIAGINLNSAVGADAFSPDLYPDIVKSTPFLTELLDIPVKDIQENIECSLFEYMDEYQKSAWWSKIIGFPFRLLGYLRSSQRETDKNENKYSVYFLSQKEERVLTSLNERIEVNVDKKTSVITLTVKMQDPLISAELADIVLANLQDYIIAYRTQKAKQDQEFTEKVFNEAKSRYFNAQKEYAGFKDANKHISTAIAQTEQEKLQNEMNLAFSVYNSLAQKLEQERLRVQEQTPVFAVIEPAKVSLKPFSPRKALILIGFVFSAGILSVGYILFKEPLSSIITEIKEKK